MKLPLFGDKKKAAYGAEHRRRQAHLIEGRINVDFLPVWEDGKRHPVRFRGENQSNATAPLTFPQRKLQASTAAIVALRRGGNADAGRSEVDTREL